MRRIIFALFIVTFLSCFEVYSQDNPFDRLVINPCGNRCIEKSGKDYISIYSYAEEKQFVFTVTTEIIKKSPLWNLGEDNPSISVNDAIETAHKKLKDILTEDEIWKQDKVEIRNYQNSAFYVVWFKSKKTESDNSFKIVVLSNGEAIEPKINTSKDD